MGRSALVFAVLAFASIGLFVGCGNNGPGTAAETRPAQINLTPATNISMDLGTAQTFTAALLNFRGTAITGQVVTWQTSNSSVLTISSGGIACAGTWDSVTAPRTCTPGPAGVAQVTATSLGITSPPTTVYVHPHVDSITVSLVPTNPPPTNTCISKGLKQNYQATAFSRGVDVTADVGPFTWQVFNPTVALVNSTVSGLALNQVQVTGNLPGNSQIYANAAGVNSSPLPVQTCLVQHISLEIAGTGATTFNVNVGAGVSIIPTVIDSAMNTITGVPLTFSSSSPGVATVGASGNITSPAAGGAAVTASCTPPTCNIGTSPIQPIYSSNVITGIVSRSSGTVAPNNTVWVSSRGCLNQPGCVSSILSVATSTNTVQFQVTLGAVPDSLVFTPTGSSAFIGTDKSLFGTTGLMVLNPAAIPPAVNTFTSVAGKVLAVSSDGTKVILSDTVDTPNAVYIAVLGSTGTVTSSSLAITGATAATFSPDGLKAYILAGNKLYVQSTVEPLLTISVAGTLSAASFLSQGGFAYVAGETANTVTVRKTCDNAIATDVPGTPQIISTSGTPSFLQALPDSTHVLGVTSPGITLIPVTLSGTLSDLSDVCTSTTPAISNGAPSFFNLGQGNFVPMQLIVNTSGTAAYVLSSNLPSILVFDIGNQSASTIALAGNAMPLNASLSTDGTTLYVGANDNSLHVIDTNLAIDTTQVTFPKSLCLDSTGNDFPGLTCQPDLVAVRP